MKKATKGALAAAAAGSLLLGGAGSLAYWTSTGTVAGDSITSGHLQLVQSSTDCDADWQLTPAGSATAVAYVAQVLKPGDTLSKHCSYTVNMAGNSLVANLSVSAPGFDTGTDSALSDDLTLTPTYKYDADPTSVPGPVTLTVVSGTATQSSLVDGGVVDVKIDVAYKNVGSANNTSNPDNDPAGTVATNLAAVLADVTVTAEQAH